MLLFEQIENVMKLMYAWFPLFASFSAIIIKHQVCKCIHGLVQNVFSHNTLIIMTTFYNSISFD